jgi:site-specific recombinase XerD
MSKDAILPLPSHVSGLGPAGLPAIIARDGPKAGRRFIEFFTATIRNKNTRAAYAQAVRKFFDWCDDRGIESLDEISPVAVAAYIEQHPGSRPTVKQHLAAIRVLFDWLVTGQIVPHNPAASVRGPKHVVRRGKTPVLTADETRTLLDSIDVTTIVGLRDRALIALMVYTFARVSAAVAMRVEDYFSAGKRWWVRLHEKGGKRHEVPAHHNLEAYLDTYLQAGGIADEKKSPLFRSVTSARRLTSRPVTRNDALRMVKRRARAAGLPSTISCHTFRATGITAYLDNGGSVENAQAIAAHESPRTTKLYDRTADEITLDEVERIAI